MAGSSPQGPAVCVPRASCFPPRRRAIKTCKPSSYMWLVRAPVSSRPVNEPSIAREVPKGNLKDARCSSYLQFCNKSVGSDNVQGCHPKYFIGVVYSVFLENFCCDWDGGVNLVNPREGGRICLCSESRALRQEEKSSRQTVNKL